MATVTERRRGRPRSVEADARILDAALAEYAERGWSGFTLDAVARRAGVGKSSLYLRWPGKQDLLADAVRSASAYLLDIDTGSLRTDLEAVARSLFAYLLTPVGFAALRVSVDAAGSSEPLGDFVAAVVHPHNDATAGIIAKAADRGEISRDTDVASVVECLQGAVLVQVLSLPPGARGLDDDAIAALTQPVVELLLSAVKR